MKKNITKKVLINLGFSLVPLISFAQAVTIPNPLSVGNNLMTVLVAILNNIVLPIGAVLVVMYVIYAGFTFVSAQGKPAEIDKAKQRLLWSLIGGGILLGSAAISRVVETTVRNITN